jgi:hypothetical protein
MKARIAIVNKQQICVNEKHFYENHDVMRSRDAKNIL